MKRQVLWIAAFVGCAAPANEPAAKPELADSGVVADSDSGTLTPACDGSKPFGVAKKLSVNTTVWERGARLSSDELTLYFSRLDEDGFDIFSATRPTRDAPFGSAAPVAKLNYPNNHNTDPMLSADGLRVFFSRGFGNNLIAVATRASVTDDWNTPTAVLNSDVSEEEPYLTFDGSELWFSREQPYGGSLQLHVAKAKGDGFDLSRRVTELTPGDAVTRSPVLTKDGLTLYYATSTPTSSVDVYVAHRTSMDAPFASPQQVPELSSERDDFPNWISPDGCRIYLTSDRDAGNRGDLYVAER